MSPKVCRSLVIETLAIESTKTVSLIGQSVSRVVLLLTNGLTSTARSHPMTHMTVDIVIDDLKSIQVIPMVDIGCPDFGGQYYEKLKNIGYDYRPDGNYKPDKVATDMCDCIARTVGHIKEAMVGYNAANGSKRFQDIELTYVCGRHKDQVMRDFCKLFVQKRVDLSFLSTLNIVCIEERSSSAVVSLAPLICRPTGSSVASKDSSALQIPDDLFSLMEVQTIDATIHSIDGYFKSWLHEPPTGVEMLRICLMGGTDDQIVVKCDVRQAILDISRAANGYDIKTNPLVINIWDTNGCDLYLIGSVSKDGLCDSVTYGIPYVLSPNCSPELSHTEVEDNWSRFYGLASAMNLRKSIALLESRHKLIPKNLFALMSSADEKTLLLKPIATKELIIPYFNDTVTELFSRQPSPAIVQSISQQLSRLPYADIYCPLYLKSDLFDYLQPQVTNQHTK